MTMRICGASDSMPYTRREYIERVPQPKIRKFTMGNSGADFDYSVELLSLKGAQISHNALEAARVAANRFLESELELKNYTLKVVPYPHQIVRKHKRINVPQADRFQKGMRLAYGRPVGTAAVVDRGDTLMIAEVSEDGIDIANEALIRASNKLPVSCRIDVNEN
jgi:large subunit ribosomal protein L10e